MVKIARMRTNRIETPLGYYLGRGPRFSWVTEGTGNQESARVEVSLLPDFSQLFFDSGRQKDIDSLCYRPKLSLKPRTRYYWRVTVWADNGDHASSEAAWFETGKMDEPWKAQWITPEFDHHIHPVIFQDFSIGGTVKSARLYACGLGLYECSIGGIRVGDECLSPGFTAYDMWVPYQSYDVTGLLTQGGNHIEFWLGNGWYKGDYGIDQKRREVPFYYGEEFALRCELIVTLQDDSEVLVASDTGWKAKKSTIMDSSIYDGETLDDTFADETVYGVKATSIKTKKVEERRSPPIRLLERVQPVEIIHTPKGETVLDMGQNMVGWLEFTNRAPRGKEIHLQFGEVMQDDCFYRDNLRGALAEFHYISDGVEKKVRQRFTFYGFRFVKLTKWHGEVDLKDFSGCVLYSDMDRTGYIKTDHPKINKLFENTLWGMKGNFLDVPTDCPQRDERMGWTGDAQVFFGTAAFNMDVYSFFTKYLRDLWLEQTKHNGAPPVVIPAHCTQRSGSCAWGDAATIIPWNMYVYFGDKDILETQYVSMKAWVDYIKGVDEAHGGKRLWQQDFHFGDWLSLDNDDPVTRFGGTDPVYLASAFYRYSSMLVAKAARVLGRDDEAKAYQALSDQVRDAIQEEYFTPVGRLAVNTQTAYILALYMDLAPDDKRDSIAFQLRCKLKESNYHLRTGFIGTPYLCRVLSNHGSNDIAYRLLLQEDYPSWLYSINMGATTIWERWNSILPDGSISSTGMNSLNHYAYGSIIEWMYRDVAGIQPLEEGPGFRRFRLAPKPYYLLKNMECRYESPVGTIESNWKITDDGAVEFFFKVPFGAVAELELPHAKGTEYEGSRELASGEHSFRYQPSVPYRETIDINTPVNTLWKNPEAKNAIEEVEKVWDMFRELNGNLSIPEANQAGIWSFNQEQISRLDEKLKKL